MNLDLRYLSLGFAVGVAATAAVAASVVIFGGPDILTARAGLPDGSPAPAPDLSLEATRLGAATPTLRPWPTSTTIALPSLTAFPTLTPDPVIVAISAGRLIYTGPLSYAQQAHLYAASLKYIQSTVRGSILESKAINGVGYGDPSNICGPLAIAILRDAGLIAPLTNPHDFWLLDPTVAEDQRKLERVFPPLQFERIRVLTPINKVDWKRDPLVPGDFLFIWHGSGGNFDHMLVVNRVDRYGRAFAVTNFGTPDGFLIAETMLYDPNDSDQGSFHIWTQERDAILGSTGFGGFELWRLRTP